jgi:hypothetical protein
MPAMRFRDGTTFAKWERWLTAIAPNTPPRMLDVKWTDTVVRALGGEPVGESLAQVAGDLCIEGESRDDPDPILQNRLAELDAQYMGWWTELVAGEERLADLEIMHARRRMFEAPGTARPTLPASILCRALTIEALSPRRVLLLGDADGLGIALAVPEVTAVVTGKLQRRWLATEAARAARPVTITGNLKRGEPFDLTVADAGTLTETRRALVTAIEATRPGGHLLLSIRYPWESHVYPLLEACGFEVESYLREVSHYLLPGIHVVDGAADLLLLRRTAAVAVPSAPETVAADIRAQPFALVELEGLDRDRLDSGAIDRFARAVEAYAPRPQEMRDSVRDAERDLLWWYDIGGFGFSAELRHDHAHLAVALAPFDPALEWVVLCSAFWTLGDTMTRTFPMRTGRTCAGEVMA